MIFLNPSQKSSSLFLLIFCLALVSACKNNGKSNSSSEAKIRVANIQDLINEKKNPNSHVVTFEEHEVSLTTPLPHQLKEGAVLTPEIENLWESLSENNKVSSHDLIRAFVEFQYLEYAKLEKIPEDEINLTDTIDFFIPFRNMREGTEKHPSSSIDYKFTWELALHKNFSVDNKKIEYNKDHKNFFDLVEVGNLNCRSSSFLMALSVLDRDAASLKSPLQDAALIITKGHLQMGFVNKDAQGKAQSIQVFETTAAVQNHWITVYDESFNFGRKDKAFRAIPLVDMLVFTILESYTQDAYEWSRKIIKASAQKWQLPFNELEEMVALHPQYNADDKNIPVGSSYFNFGKSGESPGNKDRGNADQVTEAIERKEKEKQEKSEKQTEGLKKLQKYLTALSSQQARPYLNAFANDYGRIKLTRSTIQYTDRNGKSHSGNYWISSQQTEKFNKNSPNADVYIYWSDGSKELAWFHVHGKNLQVHTKDIAFTFSLDHETEIAVLGQSKAKLDFDHYSKEEHERQLRAKKQHKQSHSQYGEYPYTHDYE